MIPSWLSQITSCLIFTCNGGPTSFESNNSKKKDNPSTKKTSSKKNKSSSFGSILLTSIASTTTASFSSWTESYTSSITSIVQQEEEEITMVFTRDNKRRTSSSSSDVERHRGMFLRKVMNKNQLTSPVSPYDELPIIQDLVEQLTPNPGSRKQQLQGRTEEEDHQQPQERQQSNDQRKKTVRSDGRDEPEDTHHLDHDLPGYNSAHDVPTMIAIPTHPTYSEDSDLTLDGIWKQKGDSSSSSKPTTFVRTLTPHPSFEEILPNDFC